MTASDAMMTRMIGCGPYCIYACCVCAPRVVAHIGLWCELSSRHTAGGRPACAGIAIAGPCYFRLRCVCRRGTHDARAVREAGLAAARERASLSTSSTCTCARDLLFFTCSDVPIEIRGAPATKDCTLIGFIYGQV